MAGGKSFLSMSKWGNIGTEVGRINRAQKNGNASELENARDRALELLDLTLSDPRRAHQLKEIARARELLVDSLSKKPIYGADLASLDKYFMQFAIAARLHT